RVWLATTRYLLTCHLLDVVQPISSADRPGADADEMQLHRTLRLTNRAVGRGGHRLALDELDVQRKRAGNGAWRQRSGEQALHRQAADGFLVHAHRRQRWDQVLRHLDIVEADYRDIP